MSGVLWVLRDQDRYLMRESARSRRDSSYGWTTDRQKAYRYTSRARALADLWRLRADANELARLVRLVPRQVKADREAELRARELARIKSETERLREELIEANRLKENWKKTAIAQMRIATNRGTELAKARKRSRKR